MKTKLLTCIILPVLLFVSMASQGQYKRSRIGFFGVLEYNLNFETGSGTMTIPEIRNDRSGGTSGTLFLEVWLMKKKYKGKLHLQGYKLTNKRIGELQAGYHFTNLSYPLDWNLNIPPGKYYVVYVLSEYDSSALTDYRLSDYMCFSTRVEVTEKKFRW